MSNWQILKDWKFELLMVNKTDACSVEDQLIFTGQIIYKLQVK